MMSKKIKVFLVLFWILLIITPIVLYLLNFRDQIISKDTQTWGHFGDYLNGTFMPLIALTGVIVTLALHIISDRRNETNLKIEQQKQRPLLHIGYYDFEDKIQIFMKNKGIGPLLIENYRVVNVHTNKSFEGLFECLPKKDISYDNYTGNKNNTVLSPDETDELLLFTKKSNKKGKEQIRKALSVLKIVVDYKDVYNNSMPTYERSLKWFGRS